MYNIIYETSRKSRLNARYWMLGAGALGRPRGRVWGRRREEGPGWGTRVYQWWIHVDIWQNQYNIVKLKIKKKRRLIKWPGRKKQKKQKNTDVLTFLPLNLRPCIILHFQSNLIMPLLLFMLLPDRMTSSYHRSPQI